jgi:hypothetical protein
VALGQVFSKNLGSPANLHSICFSTMIFTITRGWHNRPGVAAMPIASQTRIKKKTFIFTSEVSCIEEDRFLYSRKHEIYCSSCPDILCVHFVPEATDLSLTQPNFHEPYPTRYVTVPYCAREAVPTIVRVFPNTSS